MDDLYTRLGQVIAKSLHAHFSGVRQIPAPGNRMFGVRLDSEPWIGRGNWAFLVNIEVPDDAGDIQFMIAQMGSGLRPERVSIPLPPKDYVDDIADEFPPAHKDAYFDLMDDIERIFEANGFRHSSDGDYLINADYYPSTALSIHVVNPSLLNRRIAEECQRRLQAAPFTFSIYLNVEFDRETNKEDRSVLIIRPDRIVEDWNRSKVAAAANGKLDW